MVQGGQLLGCPREFGFELKLDLLLQHHTRAISAGDRTETATILALGAIFWNAKFLTAVHAGCQNRFGFRLFGGATLGAVWFI